MSTTATDPVIGQLRAEAAYGARLLRRVEALEAAVRRANDALADYPWPVFVDGLNPAEALRVAEAIDTTRDDLAAALRGTAR